MNILKTSNCLITSYNRILLNKLKVTSNIIFPSQKLSTSLHVFSNSDPENDLETADFVQQLKKDFEIDSSSTSSTHPKKPLKSQSLADTWKEINRKSYENFDLGNSRIIYDAIEEEMGIADMVEDVVEIIEEPAMELKRGENGVFDLEPLCALLKEEKAKDLIALKLPVEAGYGEHMVFVSGFSTKHLTQIGMTVRKYYLKIKNKKDSPVILEGKGTNWIAVDLGNIILHIMMPWKRKQMDIERLWAVGPEYDLKCQQYGDSDEYTPFEFNLDNANFIVDDPSADADDTSSFTADFKNSFNEKDDVINKLENSDNSIDITDNCEVYQDLTTENVFKNFYRDNDVK